MKKVHIKSSLVTVIDDYVADTSFSTPIEVLIQCWRALANDPETAQLLGTDDAYIVDVSFPK